MVIFKVNGAILENKAPKKADHAGMAQQRSNLRGGVHQEATMQISARPTIDVTRGCTTRVYDALSSLQRIVGNERRQRIRPCSGVSDFSCSHSSVQLLLYLFYP